MSGDPPVRLGGPMMMEVQKYYWRFPSDSEVSPEGVGIIIKFGVGGGNAEPAGVT